MLVGDVVIASLAEIRRFLRDPMAPFLGTAFIDSDQGALDQGAWARRSVSGSAGDVTGSMGPQGSGSYTVDAARDSILVISYGWLQGWQATVDGREVPVVRTNGLVLGVPVSAGRHVVDVRFRPPGLGWGMLLGLLAVSGLAASPTVGVFRRRGGRRRAVSDPIPSAHTSTFATGTPAG